MNQTIQNMGLSPEEAKVIIDFNVTDIAPTVLIASSSQVSHSTLSAVSGGSKLGVCTTVRDGDIHTYIAGYAKQYYQEYHGIPNGVPGGRAETIPNIVTIKEPTHGKLVSDTNVAGDYRYIPNQGFVGDYNFVVTASFYGNDLVTIYYTLKVDPQINRNDDTLCDEAEWKISSLPTGTDSTTITYSNLINSAVDTFKRFSDLPAGEVGNTTGEGANAVITLDANAAGYGWFMDATPLSNDEFLPTADANIWVANVTTRYNQLLSEQTVTTHIASATSSPLIAQSPTAPLHPSLPSSGLLFG